MRVNYLGVIAGILALVSLVLAWWTVGFMMSAFGVSGDIHLTAYLHRATMSMSMDGISETSEISVSALYSQLTLILVLIGGLAAIAGSLIVGAKGKNVLYATGFILLLSIFIYAVGLQSELSQALEEEWTEAGLHGMPDIGLFSSGSTTIIVEGTLINLEYSSNLNVGFWLTLIAASLAFVSAWKHPEAEVELEAPAEKITRFCISCGRVVAPDVKFCPYCGKPLPE